MKDFGTVLGLVLLGYLGWAAFKSIQDKRLTLPLITGDIDTGNAANPDELAQHFQKELVQNKGFKAIVHPNTIPQRDALYQAASALSNDQLKSLYQAFNKKYQVEAKGTLTKVISDATGDPFDKFNTKSNLVKKLRSLGCN